MNAQQILNEIERESKKEEIRKESLREFVFKNFYPTIYLQKKTDKNFKECVGK